MNADLDRVIARIKKLLALAERAGEGEQAAALAQVDRLMREYDLSREKIGTHVERNKYGADGDYATKDLARYGSGWYLTNPQKAAIQVLLCCFHVRTIQDDRRRMIEIFGQPHHIAIATHVFVFLTREFRDRLKQANKRDHYDPVTWKRIKLDAYSYCLGMASRVVDTIRAARPPGSTDLVKSEPVQRAFDAQYGHLSETERKKCRDGDMSGLFGYRDARDIQIHKPLRDRSGSADRSVSEVLRIEQK